ncbi:UNVERIFIED_ORG: hypothetical protein B5F06_02275 [Lacrimispora saccharolytica]
MKFPFFPPSMAGVQIRADAAQALLRLLCHIFSVCSCRCSSLSGRSIAPAGFSLLYSLALTMSACLHCFT